MRINHSTMLTAVCVLLILFAAANLCMAQNTAKKGFESEKVSLDDLRRQGSDALYNLDYKVAQKRFLEVVRLFPEHPAGAHAMATSIWFQELNRLRRLSDSLYSSDSTPEMGEPLPAELVNQFREWIRKAKLLSETRLRKNSKDVEALYFLGAAESLNAAFAASIERRYLGASKDASSAVGHHRQVLKLDPNYYDAELSIGLYNYVLGSLPFPIRLLASLRGMRGSKTRGFESLERVADKGKWARDVARVVLIDLYKREKRWDDALELSRDLAKRYPENYQFQLQIADTLISRSINSKNDKQLADDQRNAFSTIEGLIRNRSDQGEPVALAVIRYRHGETLLKTDQHEKGAREFLAATKLARSEPGLAALARLRAAQALDLAGKRNEALAEYQAVLNGANVYNVHEQARRGLRERYK